MGISVTRRLLPFVVAFGLLAVSNVDACRCVQVAVCDGVAESTVVVRAEALARSDQVDINDDVTYTIRTVAVYKYPTEADDERPEELTFTTGGNGGVCGISLTIGTEYLLGLTFNLDGELTADSCDLFRHWDGLTDDELSLLETNCFDSSCDGNCEWGTQACVLLEGNYTCANTVCDPSLCAENESCTLDEWDCTEEPCPALATCTESCTQECPEGETCVLDYDVMCTSAPCAPIPECVEDDSEEDPCDGSCTEFQECLMNAEGTEEEEPYCADTCAAGTCGENQTCTLEQVECIRAPCPPFAVCTDTPTPAPPTEPPTAGGEESGYLGCFEDSREDRVLTFQLRSPEMTTELCLDICAAEGAAYAGTQYAYECWCYLSGRSDFDRHGSGAVCDKSCSGDEEDICGGSYALSLYKLDWPAAPADNPEYLDCYRDDRTDRVMTERIKRDDMTPTVCREHCLGKDAAFYGTQYSSECWCGFSTDFADYTRHGEGVCHLECSGESDLACGGNYAFDLFQVQDELPMQ